MERKSKLLAVFVFNAIALVVVIAAICAMGLLTIRANAEASRHRVVSRHLLTSLSTLKDAETGQRGYLLTGKEEYLKPYNDAVARIQSELSELSREASAGYLPSAEVDQLSTVVHHKVDELEETIVLRRTKGLPAALEVVQSDYGFDTMNAIRALVDRMNAQEGVAFDRAQQRAASFVRYSIAIVIISALLGLGILNWSYRFLKHESAVREATALELQRQKDLLEVTLSSIGDAVIVTDNSARVTFLNRVAENLTGWTRSEALDQPCTSVFHIVNEESHQTVESPVDKVLRMGAIVGLANHTLLIRKDGVELPIDDSGSPIRETDGTVRGVVLIFRDFSEYRAGERKLIQARDEAEAANHAKDHFLASLSHELRTPLTPVLAILSNWELNQNLPPSILPTIRILRRNIQLEARLIDDLLDLARITKGKLTLNLETLDINELVEGVVDRHRSEINLKHLTIEQNLGAQQHHVRADAVRLEQVFSNVLSNAIKFTPPGGKLALSTRNEPDDGRVAVTFADNGIGMSQDTIAKMFIPFERGESDAVRRAEGLGLGMAIAKNLIDAHKGTITAASAGTGQGSTFTISLFTTDLIAPEAQPSPGLIADGASMRGYRILFVEDHADSAEIFTMLLQELGYKVDSCTTVADALKLANENRFDLLISDIGLPDGSGIDLLRAIRQHSTLPAIALTGYGMDTDVARYKQEGFNGHLTKPVDMELLRNTIRQLLVARESELN
jgi:PAS domain S-box-containing protein